MTNRSGGVHLRLIIHNKYNSQLARWESPVNIVLPEKLVTRPLSQDLVGGIGNEVCALLSCLHSDSISDKSTTPVLAVED